jgi:site-specific DNA-adenine methylase
MKSPFPDSFGRGRLFEEIWKRFGTVETYIEPFFHTSGVVLNRPFPAGAEIVNDTECAIANFWRAIRADSEAVVATADYPVSEVDYHARFDALKRSYRRLRRRILNNPEDYDIKAAAFWLYCASFDIEPRREPFPNLWRDAEQRRLYLANISRRLRSVQLTCRDWSEAVSLAPGTGLFICPPSDASSLNVRLKVRNWSLESGERPGVRIALFGIGGEGNEILEENGWSVFIPEEKSANRIWFSPSCLRYTSQPGLF